MRFDSAEDAPLKLLKTPENFLLYRYSMHIASGGGACFLPHPRPFPEASGKGAETGGFCGDLRATRWLAPTGFDVIGAAGDPMARAYGYILAGDLIGRVEGKMRRVKTAFEGVRYNAWVSAT